MALCVAFSYAELATVYPRTGGYVVYVREIFGDHLAFVYAWAAFLVLYPSTVATIARAFGRYLSALVGWEAGVTTVAFTDFGPGAWFLALVGVMWCYEGFLEIVVVAGEVRDPARSLARVLVGSVVVMIAVYLLYNGALLGHLGLGGMDGSPAVASDLAHALAGSAGARFVQGTVVLATASAVVTWLFTGPRILVALVEQGLFYRAAGAVTGRGTPAVAIVMAGLVGVAYATVGTFEELVKYFGLMTGLFSAMILGGGMFLRWKGRVAPENRRIPWWPLPPLVAMAMTLGGVVQVMRDQPRASAVGIGILVVALPLARVFVKGRPRA